MKKLILLLICASLSRSQQITPQNVNPNNKQGNGNKFQFATGTTTTGDCPKYDANGNLIDSGLACPAGGAAVTSVFGRTGAVVATSGDYTASLVTNAAATNAANTFSGGFLQSFSGDDLLLPIHGTDPGTCSAGQLEFNNTSGQLKICNPANSWSPPLIPPSGTGTQYLQVQPNTLTTTYRFNNLPIVNVTDYNFPAFSCNVSLSCTVGGTTGGVLAANVTNTVTYTPCPLGMNGGDTGHRFYITGGVGTAEAVLITGGSCTTGNVAGGTITFVPVNAHSGAFTFISATGGLAEAQQALSGTGGTIYVTAPITMHAAINAIASTAMRFVGTGELGYTSPITRGSDYPSGDIFASNVASFLGWTFENMQIRGAIGSAVTGADIHITNGTLNIINSFLEDSQYGIQCNGCNGSIVGLVYIQSDFSFVPTAAIFLGAGTTVSEDMYLTNMFITGNSQGNANEMVAAIQLQGTDTVSITNSQLSNAKSGLLIDGTVAASFNVNDTFSGLNIIDNLQRGIFANGNANVCDNLVFSGINVTGDNNTLSTLGQFYGIDWGSGSTSCTTGIEFNGGTVSTFALHGILAYAPMTIQNFNIFNNNISNTAGQSGISIKAGQTGVVLTGNTIYNGASGHQAFGIVTNGAFTGTIVGNDLTSNVTAGLGSNGQVNGVIANNKSVTDVIGTITDAATITPPLNPNYTITGSGTAITAVTATNIVSGSSGTVIATGGTLTFTSGASIGDSFILQQNIPALWYFDGTKFWLSGQSPTLSNTYNYIGTETGAANAIAGTLTGVTLGSGLRVTVQLAHTLQAGADTFALNGGAAVAIKSSRNTANNIATAYAAAGSITLLYDGTQWEDVSQ